MKVYTRGSNHGGLTFVVEDNNTSLQEFFTSDDQDEKDTLADMLLAASEDLATPSGFIPDKGEWLKMLSVYLDSRDVEVLVKLVEGNSTKEAIADLCHRQWSGWMKHLFSKSIPYKPGEVQNDEGALVIPKWAVERWKRQMKTDYYDLSEEEKESDRKEADKFIKMVDTYLKS